MMSGSTSFVWKYLLMLVLVTNISVSHSKPTSKKEIMQVQSSRCRNPTDPKVSRMLEKVFGGETDTVTGEHNPVKRSSEVVKVNNESGGSAKSTVMIGGNLPLVDFKGLKKDTRTLIEQQKEMGSCLRLARETQAKLKYIWNKLSKKGESVTSDGSIIIGTEKVMTASENLRKVDLPITLQIGEWTTKT